MDACDFKFRRAATAALAAWLVLLGACAKMPQKPSVAATDDPLATLQLDVDDAQSRLLAQALAGEFALARGDLADASRAYAAAAQVSDDPRVAERGAELALAHGDPGAASLAIERMQATGAAKRSLARERIRLALLRGHRETARDELRAILAGGERDAWREAAGVLAEARDPALAGALLEELATPKSLPADDPTVWIAMSQLGVKLERHRYAESLADAAAQRFADPDVLGWAAHLKLEVDDVAGAKALFERAVAHAPDDARLRLAYASTLARLGDNKAAARVLAQGPQTLETYGARAAYSARDDDQAELGRIYAALAAEYERHGTDSAFLLGQIADARQQPELALTWYAKVPPDDAHAFEATARRAAILAQRGGADRTEAYRLIAALISSSEGTPDALRRALLLDAQLHGLVGDTDGAIAAYGRALARLPDDPELIYGRALALAEAGQTDAAIADLRDVLRIAPDDLDAMNALGYTLADSNRSLDEAKTLLARVLEAKPDEPAVIDSWGWLQYRQGHLDAAEATLRRAWEALKDPEIGTHLGEVLWQLDRRDEARAIFAAVRTLDADNATLRETLERLDP